jgi:hypothetical protein
MRNRPVLHGRFWILTHSSRLWKICAQAGPQKLARQNVGLAFAPNCGLLSGFKGTFVRFGRYRLISSPQLWAYHAHLLHLWSPKYMA